MVYNKFTWPGFSVTRNYKSNSLKINSDGHKKPIRSRKIGLAIGKFICIKCISMREKFEWYYIIRVLPSDKTLHWA